MGMRIAITGLSNRSQAILMFLAIVLPYIMVWAELGMPTDRTALGFLVADLCTGTLIFIKELLGGQAPSPFVKAA